MYTESPTGVFSTNLQAILPEIHAEFLSEIIREVLH